VSQKAHYERYRGALGGQVGMFFDGSKNFVAALQVGFSEDSNQRRVSQFGTRPELERNERIHGRSGND
jgi:hypothetical protein